MAAQREKKRPILIPQIGERSLTIGQTGSGKTAFTVWQLRRFQDSPVVIYDAKGDDKFLTLQPSRVVETIDELRAAVDDPSLDYIVVRPPAEIVGNPEALDEYLWTHYQEFEGVPAYIDEAYMFHKRGVAYRGLIGLLTRGRSRGQTCMLSTQRPAWLSMFCFTEAQKFYIFKLRHSDDKVRISSFVPDSAMKEIGALDENKELRTPPKFGFYFFDGETDALTLYGPVKLDPGVDTGYTVKAQSNANGSAESRRAAKIAWIK